MSPRFGRGFGLHFTERRASASTPTPPARDRHHDLPENGPIKHPLTLGEYALIRKHDADAAKLRKAQEDGVFAEAMRMAEKLKAIMNSGGAG